MLDERGLKEALEKVGWDAKPHGKATFRCLHSTREGEMTVYIRLDEHWLVPGEHPELVVKARDDGHSEIGYRDCRYLAPSEEVIVLPINNTSAENLSTWVGRELLARLARRFDDLVVERLRVAVEETAGQRGVYTYAREASAEG